jgi:hypothetical protein
MTKKAISAFGRKLDLPLFDDAPHRKIYLQILKTAWPVRADTCHPRMALPDSCLSAISLAAAWSFPLNSTHLGICYR